MIAIPQFITSRAPEVFKRVYEAVERDEDFDIYAMELAFMKSMECGHTSAEGVFDRILKILDEDIPSNTPSYHKDLLNRVSRGIDGGRPAIVSGDLAAALYSTRKFRHVARKQYKNFQVEKLDEPVEAAKTIAAELELAIHEFISFYDNGFQPIARDGISDGP